jgi:hypothetical protein
LSFDKSEEEDEVKEVVEIEYSIKVKETASLVTPEKKDKENFMFPDGGWECS